MASAPTDPASPHDAVAAFAARLRDLRAEAGSPSYREMARRSGCISHAALHAATGGAHLPSWETVREFVRACGASPAAWRAPWEAAARAATVTPASPVPEAAAAEAAMGARSAQGASEGVEPQPATAPVGLPEPPAAGVVAGLTASGQPSTDAERPAATSDSPAAGVAGDTRPELSPRHGAGHTMATALSALLVALLALVIALVVLGHHATPAPAAATSPSAQRSASDGSRFVGDVTLPDGSIVHPGDNTTKTWEIENTGTETWTGRYLLRVENDSPCQSPTRVDIPTVAPGERVRVSVPITAPSAPAECKVHWKMHSSDGSESFPSARPIYYQITVR